MAKIGNEAKLIRKLAEERIIAANVQDRAEQIAAGPVPRKDALENRIRGRDDALAILKSIYLELEE